MQAVQNPLQRCPILWNRPPLLTTASFSRYVVGVRHTVHLMSRSPNGIPVSSSTVVAPAEKVWCLQPCSLALVNVHAQHTPYGKPDLQITLKCLFVNDSSSSRVRSPLQKMHESFNSSSVTSKAAHSDTNVLGFMGSLSPGPGRSGVSTKSSLSGDGGLLLAIGVSARSARSTYLCKAEYILAPIPVPQTGIGCLLVFY